MPPRRLRGREFAALARFDPAKALENADRSRCLQPAREAATGLGGCGALLLMHALLMPDTPAPAALRARISELGMGPTLMNLARQVMQSRHVAFAIAICLDSTYFALLQVAVRICYRRAAAAAPIRGRRARSQALHGELALLPRAR